jgi:uncharacterized protein (DUF2147 family)
MMRNAFPCIVLALLTPALALANTQGMHGLWKRGDEKASVSIAPCGGNVCASNTWVANPAGSEKVGDVLVMTLQPKGKGMEGTAFDPQRNLTYALAVNVAENTMTTRGCLLMGLLCNEMTWTRLPPAP